MAQQVEIQPPAIASLEALVEPFLLPNRKIIAYESRYLTKPGDNYGSIMLAVKAIVEESTADKPRCCELPLIAKLPPITNELYWQIFEPQRTCVTENAVYKDLAPLLRALQRQANVAEERHFDGFAGFYGCRISLNAAQQRVDRDAVLVLEDVRVAGYKPGNRLHAYGRPEAELVLRYVADFHALCIGLRLKQAADFDARVRPFFDKFNLNGALDEAKKAALAEDLLEDVRSAMGGDERDLQRFGELMALLQQHNTAPNVSDGHFTTITHNDLWINNIMLKYNAVDGRPTKLKLVDFQTAQYESLGHDVIFFLLSSVDTAVLLEHYDNFLKLYYEAFIDCLRELDVDVGPASGYSYEAFLAEIKRVAHLQIGHALHMAKIMLADENTMPSDYKDVDVSVLLKNQGLPRIQQKMADIIKIAKKFKFFY